MHASHISYLDTTQRRVYFELFTIFRPKCYPCVLVEMVCDEEPRMTSLIGASTDVG
jgi:hypothetical protein